MHRIPLKRLCTRLLATLSLALILGGLLAPTTSAEITRPSDTWIDFMVLQFAATCAEAGGQSSVHYDFNTDGSVWVAWVTCIGQTGSWGPTWTCSVWDDGGYDCSPGGGLTRPPETIAQSVTAQSGTVVVAADTGSHDSPTPVVINQGTAGPTAPERPTPAPASTPTSQEDDRTP